MPPITKPKRQVNFVRIMLAGFIAGVSSAAICMFYKLVYTHYTTFELEQYVNVYTVTLACMAGAMLAAMGYYALSRLMEKPQTLYVFVVFLLLCGSLLAPLSPTLPDETTAPEDFSLLTVPMHVLTGLVITYLIPAIAGPPKLIYKR